MGDTVDIGILASIAEHVDIMLGGMATKQKNTAISFWLLAYQNFQTFCISLPAFSTKILLQKKNL